MSPSITMEETMLTLLPYAVESGVSIGEFWDSTPREIFAITKLHYENNTAEFKRQVSAYRGLAYMIGSTFSGKLPGLYEVYPELFAKEAEEAALLQFKTTMLEYAAANNAKREEAKRGENNSSRNS